MLYTIWYHLYSLKNVKNTWRNATFSEVAGFKFTESNSPPWVFLKFLKLCKWHQIAQNFTYNGRTVVITVTSPNLHVGVTWGNLSFSGKIYKERYIKEVFWGNKQEIKITLGNKIINFIEAQAFPRLYFKRVFISLSDKVTSSKELSHVSRNVTKDLCKRNISTASFTLMLKKYSLTLLAIFFDQKYS